MRARAATIWLEGALLLGVGCSRREAPADEPLLAPRAASPFVCDAGACRQEYPRLPDTGEWRCAERGQSVWCAGGEPAAGVVSGLADPSFRCGARGGAAVTERVCIDPHPDYPRDEPAAYHCSYAQELGIARVCQRGASAPAAPLPSAALAACWLDADCRSHSCDRGACRCATDAECERGRCRAGLCSGAGP